MAVSGFEMEIGSSETSGSVFLGVRVAPGLALALAGAEAALRGPASCTAAWALGKEGMKTGAPRREMIGALAKWKASKAMRVTGERRVAISGTNGAHAGVFAGDRRKGATSTG
jgi:hypothetical protein